MRGYGYVFAAIMLGLVSTPAAASPEPDLRNEPATREDFGRAGVPWLLFGGTAAANASYLWTGDQQLDGDDPVFGYRWRKFSFEQQSSDLKAERGDLQLYRTRISRLSYKPAENVVLQLARGKISGLDYLMADDSLRRTAVSAAYIFDLPGMRVENMLAWGRSSRKMRQSTSGVLLESVVRFSGVHSVFGRLEQVGSDEPAVAGTGAGRTWSRLNRLSLGYMHEFDTSTGDRVQLGGFVSHYRIPEGAGYRQADPMLYMMVLRLRLR